MFGKLHITLFCLNPQVWYDHENKLLRYDYRNSEEVAPFYTTNPISEVHDYSTGNRDKNSVDFTRNYNTDLLKFTSFV